MALTKDDIEQAINASQHPEKIRHSLSNYFEDLEKPVAVAISLNATKTMNSALEHECIAELANNLRKKGIDAVSYLDKEAAQPDKYIITPDGIQTPVLSAEDALKATILIEDQVCSQDNIILSGHANLLNNSNLVYSAERKSKTDGRVLDIKASHPHPENIAKILEKYGEDYDTFIDRKVSEATAQAITIDAAKMDEHNMMNGREYVWRGATFVGKPFATVAPRNARRIAYASPELFVSRGYTGYGSTSSGSGGASFPRTKSGKNYGCLYKFKTLGDEQIYYADTGLEAAANGTKHKKEEQGLPFETGVLEHKNEVLAMYLQVGPDKYFPIPIDEKGHITDPEWRDFAALHEPSDDSVYGYMAQRLDAQKRELDANPEHCYKLELKELAPTEIEKKAFNAEEFATALAYRGNIQKEDDGHITINQNIDCDIDIKKVDFSQLTINGTCTLRNIGSVSVFDLPKIKETETGLSTKLFFRGEGQLTDVDKISTDELLKITRGWSKEQDLSNSVLSIDNNISLDSLPKDFNARQYNHVSIDCYVDTIQDYPQTQMGCCYLKIRNQSSIEDMTVDAFQSKIRGNFGKTIGTALSLSTTNITTMPKDMKYETLESVTLNPKVKVVSLDNYPKTQNGTHNINFEGDLSNLTVEEFLLKVKGEKWCKENISTLEDGTKRCKNFQLEDKGTFKITKYPKDIADYGFLGRLNQQETIDWSHEAVKQRALSKMNDKKVVLSAYAAKLVGDLSDFKCETIQITGNAEDISNIKLPSHAKCVVLSNVSKLPELPKDCDDFSLYRSNVEDSSINLQHCKDIYIENCNLEKTSITFPNSSDIVVIKDSQFNKSQKIDLSQCRRGNLEDISGGKSIKMPQESSPSQIQKLPDNVVEVSTKYLSSTKVIVPEGIKIIDSVASNGKKIPLKNLRQNLSKAQINALRKERIFAPIKRLIAKVMPAKTANVQLKAQPTMAVKKKIPQQQTQIQIQQQDKARLAELSGRNGNGARTVAVQKAPAPQKAQEQTALVQPVKQDEQTATISQPLKPAALQEQKAVAQFSGQKIADLSGQEKGAALTKMRVEADNPFSGEGFTAAKAAMSPKTEVRTQTLQNAGTVPQMAFNAAQKDSGMGSR